MLQYHFNWATLSAAAGITEWNFYFRLFPGTIRSPQVVEFLEHLLRHLPGRLLIIWDGLRQHRSRMVREFVAEQGGTDRAGVPAGLCAGAESDRIHLGAFETT